MDTNMRRFNIENGPNVDRILDGKAEAAITDRAKAAKFDERLSLLGLLLDAIDEKLRGVIREESALGELMAALKAVRLELARPNADADAALQKQIDQRRRELETGKRAGTLSEDHAFALNRTIVLLDAQRAMLQMEQPSGGMEAFKLLKADFDKQTKALKTAADKAGKQLSNVFRFCEDAFGGGQEMLIPWASPAGARALYKPLKTDIIAECTSVQCCKPGR